SRDYEQLMTRTEDVNEISPKELWGPLWSGKPPSWWEMWPDRPDKWVAPLGELCSPVWGSRDLSDESMAYLIDFGLDGIEREPDLIDRWKETSYQLVTTATKRRVDIREAVSCCKVEP